MVGSMFCASELVRKISFTGSTNVGRILTRQGAIRSRSSALNLVAMRRSSCWTMPNIDAAVEGVVVAKFRNAGQTSVCANLIYVQSGVYKEFSEKLSRRVSGLKVGNGFAKGSKIDGNALTKVKEHLEKMSSRLALA
ncbi:MULTISPECIES: aldehyde dehydrogenase family protein [Ensifer]|jgi:succinate-semialdehyde dehydrogenase/glutarate-semialdehyde dehydrogenase|uniref:Aldehyde dehydrogenase family protein n=1 Tax=Ensifer adhaerens TaxID=106592 RepID=A0A9Q8YFM3_ENSAD|nr:MULTISPECIES: aldehyde dehydrogenase family protein [Ensifer]MDF8356512.1 aldehyde dehydrogenase family protein [Ensifer adhaerens]OKP71793.1 hypothetical protein BTE77_25085 [Ensifer adhaerens]USJ27291.1 aldehyde dehydrogenase family protein [Ensifer adhaerens]WFP95207.1 aldehyde dehydrogenase family protein [Ensifer adhaerens]